MAKRKRKIQWYYYVICYFLMYTGVQQDIHITWCSCRDFRYFGVGVALSLVFFVVFCTSIVCPFSFGHCIFLSSQHGIKNVYIIETWQSVALGWSQSDTIYKGEDYLSLIRELPTKEQNDTIFFKPIIWREWSIVKIVDIWPQVLTPLNWVQGSSLKY
jgi:hypothetical protein